MIDFAEIWIAFTLLLPGEGPRVLDLDFEPRVKQACRAVLERNATGMEIDWGEKTGAAEIATLPSASEGKQFYVAWLKDRYDYNISRLNAAYGMESTSFTDLTESDFRQVDRRRPAVVADDRQFLMDLGAMLEQKIANLFQSCAPGRKTAWKRKRT